MSDCNQNQRYTSIVAPDVVITNGPGYSSIQTPTAKIVSGPGGSYIKTPTTIISSGNPPESDKPVREGPNEGAPNQQRGSTDSPRRVAGSQGHDNTYIEIRGGRTRVTTFDGSTGLPRGFFDNLGNNNNINISGCTIYDMS